MALLKLMFLAVCANAVAGQSATNSSEFYECKDQKQVIKMERMCDRRMMDCTDGSDELVELCPIECEEWQFSCKKWAQCINAKWTCDGFDDCADRTDELEEYCQIPVETPATRICPLSEFQCADGSRCLLRRFVCDNSPQCNDGSDEASCFEVKFDLPAEHVTDPPLTTTTPTMPALCNRKPVSPRCEPYWHDLAAKLKKKFVRKCLKKPTKKKCKKYRALLDIRAQIDAEQGVAPEKERAKIPRRCKKNPAHKKCRKFFPDN